MSRPIYEIAREIRRDWHNVNYAAKPYLAAMSSLADCYDDYGAESARSVILYFLGNATSWRGETAKRIKMELRLLIATGAEKRRLERSR
jgi:hypothetical protein